MFWIDLVDCLVRACVCVCVHALCMCMCVRALCIDGDNLAVFRMQDTDIVLYSGWSAFAAAVHRLYELCFGLYE